MKKAIISALTLTCVAGIAMEAPAQTTQSLNKTIYMPVEFEPSLLSISRMNSYPTLVNPDFEITRLTVADFDGVVLPASSLTAVNAPAGPETLPLSPYRGYAALGYMPVFNLGASAGYRFINTNHTSLGAWLQYDGNSYKSDTPQLPDIRLTRNTFTFDVDFAHIFPHAGRLSIDAGVTVDGYNRPWQRTDSTQTTLQIHFGADWAARKSNLAYFAGVKFRSFSYGNADYNLPVSRATTLQSDIYDEPLELLYTVTGGAAYYLSKASFVTLLADFDFLHYSDFQTIGRLTDSFFTGSALQKSDGKTLGVISLKPSYRYNSDIFSAKLGVNLQITHKSGKTFHVAPDVNLAVTPSPIFKAYVNFGGGEHINNYASLVNYTPYTSSSVAYNNSHIPVTAELGFTVGPFRGASLTAKGGYAIANDWLMPMAVTTNIRNAGSLIPTESLDYFYTPTNLRAWHASAEINWDINRMVSFNIYGKFAPGSLKHAYYLNRDRAKYITGASVTVRPIEKLDLNAAFSLRAGRSAVAGEFDRLVGEPVYELMKLKNANSLDLGGRYEIFDWLSVFARFENILNNRAGNLPYLEGQGFKGLFGAEVKF